MSDTVAETSDLINPAEIGAMATVANESVDAVEPMPMALVNELRAKAKHSLYFFAKGILGYKNLNVRIHGPLCAKLEATVRGGNKNLKVKLPRSWFKSTIASIAFPIWLTLQDDVYGIAGCDLRILICQNTATNAEKKLSEIDNHFLRNELFRCLFFDLLPNKDCIWRNNTKQVARHLSASEGTFEAVGVRTQHTSRHYDVIIEDDTVAPDFDELGIENVMPTKEDIDLAIGLHRYLIPPLFVSLKRAIWLVIGTRWFVKDLHSWIEENEPDFELYDRSILESDGKPDEFGTPAWPEEYDLEVIEKLRRKMGPYMFSCLYMNMPISAENQVFLIDWIRYYDTVEEELIVTTTVDPGGDPEDSKGEVDWTVVLTTGRSNYTGRIYILERSKAKKNVNWLLDTLFHHVKTHHSQKVGIETQGYQKMLMPLVRERQTQTGLHFVVEQITNNRKSKNQRIMGLQPLFAQHKILVKHEHADIVAELLSFPNGSHDDMIDALAMQLQLWRFVTSLPERSRRVGGSDVLALDEAIEELEQREKDKRRTFNPVMDVLQTTTVPIGERPVGGGSWFSGN